MDRTRNARARWASMDVALELDSVERASTFYGRLFHIRSVQRVAACTGQPTPRNLARRGRSVSVREACWLVAVAGGHAAGGGQQAERASGSGADSGGAPVEAVVH